MTGALRDRIKALIDATGPIPVSQYFAMCLADPEHGYYRTHEPFGRSGDFVTAPEISQLFGEMIGIFLVGAWHAHGSPRSPRLVELGPGRGTMMADILRVVEKLAPDLYGTASVHLVETSEQLRAVQERTLAGYAGTVRWHTAWEDVPDGFTLVVANEFFDAIPIRQFVRTKDGFRERAVGLDAGGDLCFTVGAATLEPDGWPEREDPLPEGTIIEIAPAREAIMEGLAGRLAGTGGVALVIDYGHLVPGPGDTLQALKEHVYDPPLAHPGEADLTSHVDFAALGDAAARGGAHVVGTACQGDFLLGLGLLERAGRLGSGKGLAVQDAIRQAVERLAAPGVGHMGELFKVLAVAHAPIMLTPFRPRD
ncbi:MAG: class I SAM-dependent methyltransferase [Pararhizobium sp.]